MNLTEQQEKTFSSTEVCRRAHVTMRQLDYWIRQGYVWPSVTDSKGSGNPRVFNSEDIDRIKRIKLLIDNGMTLKAAVVQASTP